MSTASEISVIIGASGAEATVSQLQQVQQAQQNLKQGSADAGTGFQQLGAGADGAIGNLGELTGALDDIPLALTAIATAVGAVVAAWGELMELSEEGAQIGRVFESGALAAQAYGQDMDDVLSVLRETSGGMVSDLDLVQSASKALLLGVGADADQLGQLLEIAAVRGRMMGVDTTKSFNDIVVGLGRASPRILDNLGIVIDTQAAYKTYADSIGKAASELTKAEKTQAILNATLKEAQPLLAATGGLAIDNAGQWERMNAEKANYFNTLKMELAEATVWWAEFWGDYFGEQNDVNEARDIFQQARELGLLTEEMRANYDAAVRGGQGDYTFFLHNLELVAELRQRIAEYERSRDYGTQDWAAANYEGAEAAATATAAIEAQALAFEEVRVAQEAYEQGLEALADANLELDIAVQTFHKSVGDDLVKGLRDAGLEGEELEKRLGILDGLMGTSYVMEYQMELAIDDLLEELINNPEGFQAKFEAFDSAFTPLQESVQAAMGEVALLEEQLAGLEREYNVRIKILTSGSIPNLGGGSGSGGINPDWGIGQNTNALGGPVYPGEVYLVGERGPEPFIPTVPGTIMTNSDYSALLGGGTNSTLEIDYRRLGKVITDSLIEAAEEGRFGNTLVVNSNGQRESVASNYNLLRAYGGNI